MRANKRERVLGNVINKTYCNKISQIDARPVWHLFKISCDKSRTTVYTRWFGESHPGVGAHTQLYRIQSKKLQALARFQASLTHAFAIIGVI